MYVYWCLYLYLSTRGTEVKVASEESQFLNVREASHQSRNDIDLLGFRFLDYTLGVQEVRGMHVDLKVLVLFD